MRDKFEGLDLLICLPRKCSGWKGPEHKKRMRRCRLYEESGVLMAVDRTGDRT